MKSVTIGVLIACGAVAFANGAQGYEVTESPPLKIGQILIAGNKVTRDAVILWATGLKPGQVVRYPDLRLAAINLKRLGIFEVDPARGFEPSVTLLDGEGESWDVLVTVKETSTGSLQFKPGVNGRGELVVRLVAEERNFDPWRWPTCWADFQEGRAFRGGGQKLCLPLLEIPIMPLSLPLPAAVPLDKLLPLIGKVADAKDVLPW